MSMAQEMANYKVIFNAKFVLFQSQIQELESENERLRQRIQKINDLKDELEQDYLKAKEESAKVPKLLQQIEQLQNTVEVNKTKVSHYLMK